MKIRKPVSLRRSTLLVSIRSPYALLKVAFKRRSAAHVPKGNPGEEHHAGAPRKARSFGPHAAALRKSQNVLVFLRNKNSGRTATPCRSFAGTGLLLVRPGPHGAT